MSLVSIFIFCGISFLIGLIRETNLRKYIILAISVFALFALQPNLPVRYLGFWLPVGTLIITILGWVSTCPKDKHRWGESWTAAIIIIGVILLIGISRYFGVFTAITPSLPPKMSQIIIFLLMALLGVVIFAKIPGRTSYFWMTFLVIIFILIKTPFLNYLISVNLRIINNQSTELASSFDIRWLGFSYIAFRIIHSLRDSQTGKLPVVGLADYINYVVFFPTLSAGPIDRMENFIKNMNSPLTDRWEKVGEGSRRTIIGLFKKFIIADSLSLIALTNINALQIHSTGWMWVSLYAYALQIYFDFSGYTDIAIGMGRFMGIQLPENFSLPYLRPNLTQFWNNWHMSLTQWFRAYVFNPLTRQLRSSKRKLPIPFVILVTQLSTMALIGLWHGITINFLLWGAWHGLGLFVHNRWSNFANIRIQDWATSKIRKKLINATGMIVTFNFVAVGWVFFVISSPVISWQVIRKLFGVA